jgi:octaprenyl-diphosphate synthase
MAQPASPAQARPAPLLGRLGNVCRDRGLSGLAGRLGALGEWIGDDLAGFEDELATLPRGRRVVQASAHHLLDLGGKHLRPMCVALAAKVGTGFSPAGRQLAIAVELVHSATLLHDDVVDLGEARRGAPAARVVYGNAASIFAGDWLLVEALRRIRRAGIDDLLDDMLEVIEEMILAESIQLEHRGRINPAVRDYLRVVEGKTASLFRWAMRAGARVGGLDESGARALERFGFHLGVAFQLVDDLLDVDGDASATGKALFADLREGKITYPILMAIERDPALLPVLQAWIARPEGESTRGPTLSQILGSVRDTGALEVCRDLARARADEAVSALSGLPEGPGRTALAAVAEASIHREA